MKEDWAEQLRRKLEGHEMAPPDGLWERICERMEAEGYPMGLKPEPVRQKPAINKWQWAAAAAVLALVGCFVVYEMSDSDQPLQADAVVQQQPSLSPSSEPVLDKQSPSQQQEDIVRPRQKSLSSRFLTLSQNQEDRSLDSDAKPESRTCSPDSVTYQENPTEEQKPQDHQTDKPMIQPSPQYQAVGSPDSHVSRTKHSSGSGQWTIGLNASGGLLAVNNSVRADKLYLGGTGSYGEFSYWDTASSDKSYSQDVSSSTPYVLTEHISKHRLPLRLGLSLQYQLNPRLALLSGISYSRLYSEFSFPLYPNIGIGQRLHYIGIPFGVAWQLWEANRFRIYLSGGALVEKCVSVDLDGYYSGKKPWQWSVNAAAGAEYAFTPLLGAYIEPSLGYYFSDGTQLEHYYKEHPLAPSIEFGLRMHLGR